jgi:hypothetical protein
MIMKLINSKLTKKNTGPVKFLNNWSLQNSTAPQNKTSNNILAPTVETGIQSVDIRFRNFRFFTMHLI